MLHIILPEKVQAQTWAITLIDFRPRKYYYFFEQKKGDWPPDVLFSKLYKQTARVHQYKSEQHEEKRIIEKRDSIHHERQPAPEQYETKDAYDCEQYAVRVVQLIPADTMMNAAMNWLLL